MEQNNSKRVLLSVLGVAILIVAVVGISFAALNYDKVGGTNSITTGTVTMSFAEVTKGISLTDALPISDSKGMALDGEQEYFDFSVSTNASAALTINYEINVTVGTATHQLTDEQVKIYLEKKNEAGTYVQEAAPALVSTLVGSTTRTGSKVLKTVAVNHTGSGTLTDEYRLRIWIDENVDVDSLNTDDSTGYEYHLTVNVDGTASAIGA